MGRPLWLSLELTLISTQQRRRIPRTKTSQSGQGRPPGRIASVTRFWALVSGHKLGLTQEVTPLKPPNCPVGGNFLPSDNLNHLVCVDGFSVFALCDRFEENLKAVIPIIMAVKSVM